ncbi:hypothetical protein NLU13_8652 [Sarocladium strictum]|uniref:Uncharacterized protein n=1 Tax=Sarocladium strictum TaxID=5046 RepID=A0AA39GCM1_SARSR|nr:hypothetical protein NLU13_8652 [Sarocladium strictum]
MASNPFRKSRPEDRILALDSLDTSPAPTPPPPVSFKTQLSPPPPPRSESPLPSAISTSESREKRRRSNVVKKVRVLSPPQSPDDGEGGPWPFNVPGATVHEPQPQHRHEPFRHTHQDYAGVEEYAFPSVEDFERRGDVRTGDAIVQDVLQQQTEQLPLVPDPQHAPSGPPPNPFNKTLHDLENAKQREEELHHQEELEGAALRAGNLAKGSLDVDAFRRLLMTGKPQDGTASPLPSRSQIVEDLAGEVPDGLSSASSASESSSAANSPPVRPLENGALGRSGLAVEVTREDLNDAGEKKSRGHDNSGEESESSVSVQIGTRGKKPPPPPPRHSRSTKTPETSGMAGERDVHRPIPVAPAATEGDAESLFDRDAAGKVPAPEVPSHEDQASPPGVPATVSTPKKPVPAPPPRRGHARTDTKSSPAALSPGKEEDTPPRSSMESHTSASRVEQATLGSKPVPAPPPPRRLQGNRSGSSSYTQGPASPGWEADTGHEEGESPSSKGAAPPPPPPPARHGSTRRPQSIHGDPKRGQESGGKAQHQRLGAPAPPPPRQRGSSKGSVDGLAATAVAAQHMQQQQQQQQEAPPAEGEVTGKGGDILADLEALQREVDAMRGKLG